MPADTLLDVSAWLSARREGSTEAETRSAARVAATAVTRQLVASSRSAGASMLEVDPRIAAALAFVDSARTLEPRGVVRRLAREVGASPRTLERLFLRHVGVSPRQYVLLRRVARVAAVLERDAVNEERRRTPGIRQTLSLVAHEMGFADHAHLTRSFRRIIGVRPSEYRIAAAREPIARLWVGMPPHPALPLGALVAAESSSGAPSTGTRTPIIGQAIAV
jgi:AraC-like DNA-binding protein